MAGSLYSSTRTFCYLASCCLILSLGTPFVVFAQDDNAEYQLKLAFLYNFAQFVQWPSDAFPDAGAPLTICIVGPDPFNSEGEQDLRSRKIGNHPIDIKTIKSDQDPRACQLVFVRASKTRVADEVLHALKGSSTLTVGETKGFAELGGLINLTVDNSKLRFEINLDAAMQTRLKISAKLLALAKIVKVKRTP